MPFFRRENCPKCSFVTSRKRFDFGHVTSHVCTLSKVNMVYSSSSESISISGPDYSNFEASMEREHSETVYEPVVEIRPSRFEPTGRT